MVVDGGDVFSGSLIVLGGEDVVVVIDGAVERDRRDVGGELETAKGCLDCCNGEGRGGEDGGEEIKRVFLIGDGGGGFKEESSTLGDTGGVMTLMAEDGVGLFSNGLTILGGEDVGVAERVVVVVVVGLLVVVGDGSMGRD